MSSSSERAVYVGVGVIVFVILCGLTTLFTSWRNVDPGNVGVVISRSTGEIEIIRTVGWHQINAFNQSWLEYPAIDQNLSGDVTIRDNEGQPITATVSLQYRLSTSDEDLERLIRSFGGAPMDVIQERVVVPAVRESTTTVMAQFGWEDIFSAERVSMALAIEESVKLAISSRGIEVIDFSLRDVDLPQRLDDAINAKITAQQKVDQAQFELEETEVRAKQRMVEAQANADAVLIQAQAEAEANRLLSTSVTDTLVRYLTAQKWNGVLSQVSGSVTPIVDLAPSTPTP